VLAALYVRERTGRGQWVHTSLLEAMVNFMDFQAARWLIDGEVPGQAGNDHPTLVPMGAFETADGMLNVAVMGDWEAFLGAIDEPGLRDDPRFFGLRARVEHRAELRALIAARLRGRTTAEWMARLGEAGVACGPVYAMDAVFADPQVRHLALTRRVGAPGADPIEVLRHPVTLSDTPTGVGAPPPAPGQHTRRILAEHGYSPEEIEALVASGAVAAADPD
jgi:crotonobetainyl-CoA:carnitine CoA-transferase CaiB-like acyl-CoA transferase